MSTEKGIKSIPFDGTTENYRMWARKFDAFLEAKDLASAIEPRADPDAALDADALTKNKKAYGLLMLAMGDDKKSFLIVDQATRPNLPKGDAALAWERLKRYYEPSEEPDKMRVHLELYNNKMDADQEPEIWISELEQSRARFAELNTPITDDQFLTIILCGLPTEYKTTIDVLYGRRSTLTIEEVKMELRRTHARFTGYCRIWKRYQTQGSQDRKMDRRNPTQCSRNATVSSETLETRSEQRS